MRQLMLALVAGTVLWLISAPALADVGPWERQEGGNSGDWAHRLAEEFGVQVEAPETWRQADLESLYRGAQMVPKSLWNAGDVGPWVRQKGRKCHFSMGRYTERCPTYGEEGAFLIYEAAPLVGEGAMERLAILTREEQRDLQLRRAMVHMVVGAVDREQGWSKRPSWRVINGWPAESERVQNRSAQGFSRYLGMVSAHLDLVTFAEDYLVRPEDLLVERAEAGDEGAARRLAEVDADESVACRFFSKSRALEAFVREVEEGWEPRDRGVGDEPRCPAFEAWAQVEEMEGAELLLASASTGRPSAIFGQLMLHIRYGEEEDPVYHFGTVTEEEMGTIRFITRGALGGFESVLEQTEYGEVHEHFVGHQGRELRRYPLTLNGEDKRRLLERLWEAERQIRYPYLMTTHNSASLLVNLLDPVVHQDLNQQKGRLAIPTDILEVLVRVDRGLEEGTMVTEAGCCPDFSKRALGPAGRYRWHVGGGLRPDSDQPFVHLGFARMKEPLGEARRRGLRPEVGLTLLEVEADIAVGEEALDDIWVKATAFDYRSLRDSRLGPGLRATVEHDGRRDVWAGAAVTPSVNVALLGDTLLRNHLVLEVGPSVRYDIHRDHELLGGGLAALKAQWNPYGSVANRVYARGEAAGYLTATGERHHQLSLEGGLRQRLFSRGDRPMIVEPYGRAMETTRIYLEEESPPTDFDEWEVGLRFEVPW